MAGDQRISRLRVELQIGTMAFIRGMKSVQSSFDRTRAKARSFASQVTSLGTVMRAVLGAAAVRMVYRWGKALLDTFGVQREAVLDLASSLRSAGIDGVESLRALTAEAERLQTVTTVADEALISAVATLSKLAPALNVGELVKAQAALVGMADTFFQGDVEMAALQFGKTLSGSMNTLTRYGIAVDMAGSASERLTEIVGSNALAAAFAASMAKAEGLKGMMEQLENALGDTKEGFGEILVGVTNLDGALGSEDGLIAKITQFNIQLEANKGEWIAWGRVVTGAIGIVASVIGGLFETVKRSGAALGAFLAMMSFASPFGRNMAAYASALADFKESMVNLGTSFEGTVDKAGAWIELLKNMDAVISAYSASQEEVAAGMVGLGNGIIELSDAVVVVKEEFTRMQEAVADFGRDFVRRTSESVNQGMAAWDGFFDRIISRLVELALQMQIFQLLTGMFPDSDFVKAFGAGMGLDSIEHIGSTVPGSTGIGPTGAVNSPNSSKVGRAVGVSGMVVNQNISFSVNAIDGRSAQQFIREQRGEIAQIVADGVHQSTSYAKQIRGR